MNAEKFTKKSLEALGAAQNIAVENDNQQVTQEHLLYALIDQNGGLIGSLLRAMNVDTDRLLGEVDGLIRSLPRVTGSGREADKIYIDPHCLKSTASTGPLSSRRWRA